MGDILTHPVSGEDLYATYARLGGRTGPAELEALTNLAQSYGWYALKSAIQAAGRLWKNTGWTPVAVQRILEERTKERRSVEQQKAAQKQEGHPSPRRKQPDASILIHPETRRDLLSIYREWGGQMTGQVKARLIELTDQYGWSKVELAIIAASRWGTRRNWSLRDVEQALRVEASREQDITKLRVRTKQARKGQDGGKAPRTKPPKKQGGGGRASRNEDSSLIRVDGID